MKCGVIVFPGSNCDDDMMHVIGTVFGMDVRKIWHKETHIDDFTTSDMIFIPGGFSYGDYLRSGAIARFSPIMKSVVEFSEKGGYVFGICNGFQVLCEAEMLPGVLMRNEQQKFVSKTSPLIVENNKSLITRNFKKGEIINIPLAHAEGRYYAPEDVLDALEENNQVLFRYCDEDGKVTKESNFNGSKRNIAGIMNKAGNVFGMMPHPERAAEDYLGNSEGRKVFESIFNLVKENA